MAQVFHAISGEIHVLYYGDREIDIHNDLKGLEHIEKHGIYGYMQFIPCQEEKKLYITSLYVAPSYRNCGIGTRLIDWVIDYSLLTKIDSIHVDDMSDNFRKLNNIYTNVGFTYDDQFAGPEMTLSFVSKCSFTSK